MDMLLSQNDLGQSIAQFKGRFDLKLGGYLDDLVLVYQTYGVLAANRDNVILIHHSLATSCHVASTVEYPTDGWWEAIVGEGKAIDTRRFYVICINNLGSCFGSTGPTTINPLTQQPYQANFPALTIEDMVRSQKLLLDALDIPQLHAVIGGSMGGMLSLCWVQLFPEHAKNIMAISMSHRAYPLQLVHRTCQREAIYNDPDWQQGQYQRNPVSGLKVARMISHLFYRGLEEVDNRFDGSMDSSRESQNHEVAGYYHYNADKFAKQYDANTYLLFLDAMDAFNLDHYGDALFKHVTAAIRIVSTSTDVLYPPRHQQAVYQQMLKAQLAVKLINHQSPYGHDAFLVDAAAMSEYIVDLIGYK